MIPSITLTIYFGSEEWDGPLSLFDMMEITDARILSKMNNYYVHLIAPALMKDEEIIKFQTNLREVMLFIKYSKDKEKLVRILEANEERLLQFTPQCHLVKGERNVCRFLQRANGQGKWKCQKESRDIFHPVSLRME